MTIPEPTILDANRLDSLYLDQRYLELKPIEEILNEGSVEGYKWEFHSRRFLDLTGPLVSATFLQYQEGWTGSLTLRTLEGEIRAAHGFNADTLEDLHTQVVTYLHVLVGLTTPMLDGAFTAFLKRYPCPANS